MLSSTFKKLDAFKFDGVAEFDNTGLLVTTIKWNYSVTSWSRLDFRKKISFELHATLS